MRTGAQGDRGVDASIEKRHAKSAVGLNAGSLRCRNLSGVGDSPNAVRDIAIAALMTPRRPGTCSGHGAKSKTDQPDCEKARIKVW
jgi:hypothetical protein